ncbi:MAG: hypothetical protein ABH951_02555 [Patescibacteria group bacterium]
MNSPQNQSLVGKINAFHLKKIKSISPDIIFLIYCLVSLLCRLVLNPLLLEFFGQALTAGISFGIIVLINLIFITISDCLKIDWNGKVKKSLISKLVNLFPKKIRHYFLYPFFFIIEPFLLYVYYKSENGSISKKRKIIAWVLFASSLALASFIWMEFGVQIKKILRAF